MSTTFKNTSTAVFQDGNLVVAPGESFSTDEQSRIDQLTGAYAWQFDEVGGDAPTEAEKIENPTPVREIAGNSHVVIGEEGEQSEVIGSPEPADTKAKKK